MFLSCWFQFVALKLYMLETNSHPGKTAIIITFICFYIKVKWPGEPSCVAKFRVFLSWWYLRREPVKCEKMEIAWSSGCPRMMDSQGRTTPWIDYAASSTRDWSSLITQDIDSVIKPLHLNPMPRTTCCCFIYRAYWLDRGASGFGVPIWNILEIFKQC